MRSLVLYYSNTGNTRRLATALAGELGSDLAEVTVPGYRRFPLLIAVDIVTRRQPRIDILPPPGGSYDLVVLAGPVWAGRPAPPLLRAIAEQRSGLQRVGLFVTCTGTSERYSPKRAIAEMVEAVGKPVAATRIFTQQALDTGRWEKDMRDFAQALAAG